jgi:transcriptional regulatory protein LEU3
MLKDMASTSGLVDVYGIAIRLIEKFSALDESINLGSYSTFYLVRTLGLAAFVILRLYRSPVELVIDRERGERCYFAAIQLLRRRTVEEWDLESKLATILTELWSSSLIFRSSQGIVDSLLVRVRSRLVSPCPVFQDQISKNLSRQ